MSTIIPIGLTVFPAGDTTIRDQSLPAGLHTVSLTLDVSGVDRLLSQELVFNVYVNDGVNIRHYYASFDGPWLNKQGVLQTNSTMLFNFGSTFVNDVEVPTLSTTSWSLQAVITAVNGPITSLSGSLVLS